VNLIDIIIVLPWKN